MTSTAERLGQDYSRERNNRQYVRVNGNSIERVLSRIADTPGCRIFSPAGHPDIQPGLVPPTDLLEFYDMCGGVELFHDALFSILISPPSELINSNLAILGSPFHDDPSGSWYVVASDNRGQRISIDLHPARLGRFYDSFLDVHGVAGSSAVVASSFTDLLLRLLGGKGDHWYWLEPGFESLGDAYGEATD